jgi:hypothetical protein
MTISIGRAGLDSTIDAPDSYSWNGDQLTLVGDISSAGSSTVGLGLRDQLRGLVSSQDEPVVPLVSTDDPELNGYYTVDSMQVDTTDISLDSGVYAWHATLTAVPDSALPSVESFLGGFFRAGNPASLGATQVLPWAALPSAFSDIALTYDYTSSAAGSYSTALTRTTGLEGGSAGPTVSVLYFAPASAPQSFVMPWAIDPAHWYDGAAKVLVSDDAGSTYRNLTSRQLPAGFGTHWRLSNGIIEIAPGTSGNDSLLVRWYNGSSWSSWKSVLVIQTWNNAAISTLFNEYVGQPLTFTVTELAPHQVQARVTYSNAGLRLTLDLLLRRGAPFVECKITDYGKGSSVSANAQWISPGLAIAEAATTVTAGACLRATSNDADGNRAVIIAAQTAGAPQSPLTADVGFVASGSPSTFVFAFGAEIAGSSAVTGNKALDLEKQYYGPVGQRVSFVGR